MAIIMVNTATSALVLTVFLNGLLTDCYVIPSNQHTSNSVISDSVTSDRVQVIDDLGTLTGNAPEMHLPSTNGETPLGLGNKRSVAVPNESSQSSGFAIFEGLTGDEVGPFIHAVQGSSQQLSLPEQAGVSLGCIANSSVNSRENISEFTHVVDACPASLLSPGGNEVNERVLCPWTYVEHTDENRHPKTIPYAQCACPSCIQPSGLNFATEGGCRPIYYSLKVLRKVSCQNGIQIYESSYEEIPVACTCVRPQH